MKIGRGGCYLLRYKLLIRMAVSAAKQEKTIKQEVGGWRSRGYSDSMRGHGRECVIGARVGDSAVWPSVRPHSDRYWCGRLRMAASVELAMQSMRRRRRDQVMVTRISDPHLRRSARPAMRSVLPHRRSRRQRLQGQAPAQPPGYGLRLRMGSGCFGQSCLANSFSRDAASLNWPRRTSTCLSRSIVNSVSTELLPSF